MSFNYGLAVSRNIGWVTAEEQLVLRNARVAIAGLGGVGGVHLLTLVRLGVQNFHIADFDVFEVQNFNRQVGASMSSIGQSKSSVLAAMAKDINPDVDIKIFPEGVTEKNVDEFLNHVDVYVDGIDFFAIHARRLIFNQCHQSKIPALTAAPLGMGVSFLYFAADGMSFEEYFQLEGHDVQEQFARFIAGLSPAMLQRGYLVAPEAVNFGEQRGPSTMMSCNLCAGVVGTAVLRLLLKRGRLRSVPWAMQFDAYRDQVKFTWRPGGNSNPLQWLLLKLIRPKLKG